MNKALGLFLFLYPSFSLLSSFRFILYISSLLPFLVSGIRELRVPSKCQGSRVKHMQHVLQFITPHLPWDFALLTSLSKSCLLFANGDTVATGAGLPATRALATSKKDWLQPLRLSQSQKAVGSVPLIQRTSLNSKAGIYRKHMQKAWWYPWLQESACDS